MKENNLVAFLILLILGLFFVVFVSSILFLSKKTINVQNIDDQSLIPIYSGNGRVQNFKSVYPNLHTIFIRFKNLGRLNKDELIFRLKDSNDQILREIKISGNNIPDDQWVRFQFRPVEEVMNKDLSFEIISGTKGRENSLSLVIGKYGDLNFKVYSQRSFLRTLKDSAFDLSKRLYFDKSFISSFSIVIIFGILILLKLKNK